jgi:heat shock protein HslJ
MRLVFTLMLALALISCGKKSDDKKTETTPDATSEITQQPSETGTPDKDSVAVTKSDTSKVETDKPTPGRERKVDPLKNKRWKLVRLNGAAVEVSEDFKSYPYITFSAQSDRLTGSGGCNRFGCKYAQNDDKLTMTGFASTKMMCREAMDVEKPFLEGLANVTGYVMDGEDKLWLTKDGKRVMEFDALYLN